MPFLAAGAAALYGAGTSLIVAGASGLTALGVGGATAWAISSAAVQFGASFLFNSLIGAISGKAPTAQDVGADLAQQKTAPSNRFVYGECRATGTPAGIPVKGQYIYGAWILNSRPSALPDFTLYLDKREVSLEGNAFDLDGPGALANEKPFVETLGIFGAALELGTYVNVWISRGDHTAPPKVFTDEAPFVEGTADHLWKTTDAWRGRTIIWMRLKAGGDGERRERWPSTPPLVEVQGKWSLVCDPRDPAHDQDDPATWEWSENHALCVRDALMQNPIRQYRAGQIHNSFDGDGPDACDQIVALKSGGSEARYVCAGTVVWSEGEIEDQLNPMMISGAADFIRVGGKLGYAAGVYRAPTETLTYLLGDGFEFPDMMPGSQLVNQLRVTYLSPARGYETAELLTWDIPGALAQDGGVPAMKTLDLPFCPSATQGMRVRSIAGGRLRRQESIQGGTLPPEAFDLVGGSTVNVTLPAPYDALDGVYEIGSINPGMDPIGESGEVAMRMPAYLVKHSAAIYAWNPATDEEDVYDEAYNATRAGTATPGAISVTTGDAVNLNSGGSIVPRIRFAFTPSTSSVTGYEWQFRKDGGDWESGGLIGEDIVDGSGKVFAHLVGAAGQLYDIRVRAIGSNGTSEWSEIEGVTPVVDIVIDIPLDGQASGGVGEITASFRTPNDADFRAIEFFGSDTDDSGAASMIGSAIYTSQNTIVSITDGGLGASVTRYYFARSRGDYASASDFTASVSATTT